MKAVNGEHLTPFNFDLTMASYACYQVNKNSGIAAWTRKENHDRSRTLRIISKQGAKEAPEKVEKRRGEVVLGQGKQRGKVI